MKTTIRVIMAAVIVLSLFVAPAAAGDMTETEDKTVDCEIKDSPKPGDGTVKVCPVDDKKPHHKTPIVSGNL